MKKLNDEKKNKTNKKKKKCNNYKLDVKSRTWRQYTR